MTARSSFRLALLKSASLLAVAAVVPGAAWADAQDPVTRDQAASLAASLGGGASFDVQSGVFRPPSYLLLGNAYADVGDALSALASASSTQTALGRYTSVANPTGTSKGALSLGCSECAVNGSYVQANSSIAIGAGSSTDATGSYNNTATAEGQGSIAIGGDARGANAIAMKGTAGGIGSVALQGSTDENSTAAVALRGDVINNVQGIAIGGTLAAGTGGVELGANGHSAGSGVALGASANAADGTLAAGPGAKTVATSPFDGGTGVSGQMALGSNAKAENSGMAIGASATAAGFQSTAIGSFANAAQGADNGLALGANAQLLSGAVGSVALGSGSQTSRANVVEVGGRQISGVAAGTEDTDAVNVQQLRNALVGTPSGSVPWIASTDLSSAQALGQSGTALGANAQAGNANTAYNTAVGAGAVAGITGSANDASGGQATALGANAHATAMMSVAVGQGAQANGVGSVAIGDGSAAADANVVSFGSALNQRRLTNLADGLNSQDAMTMAQGSRLTAIFGGGADWMTSRAPDYLLTSPGAAGLYHDVGSALSALDKGLASVNDRVDGAAGGSGPAGPQGAQGPQGDTGPQGPAGTGNGHDDLAVHYDTATQDAVSLGGQSGTTVSNVKAGVADTDAANVGQVGAAQASAVHQAAQYTDAQVTQTKQYADNGDKRTLGQANAYTDWRLARQDRKIAQAGATASAIGMLALGAQGIEQPDRFVMSAAGYRGQAAVGIGFNHLVQSGRVAIAIGAAFSAGGGSTLGISVGVGLGR